MKIICDFSVFYLDETLPNGFYIGKDKYGSNIVVDFDRRDSDKTSANILILGNSGQGKSYLIKLLICNLLEAGKSVIALDAEHELEELCENLGGCFIDLMAGEKRINVLEVRSWNEDTDETAPDAFRKSTLLARHISFLKDFFRAYKDFSDPQLDTIEIMLSKLYARWGITEETDLRQLAPEGYAANAWNSGWGYVWGTFGQVLTPELLQYKISQYPEGVGDEADFIRSHWLNRRTTDCVGLIKGYGWLNTVIMEIQYGSNGMPDVGADGMYYNAGRKGSIETMPDTPGLAVWKSGHIGVYIGNGEVIEAMDTRYGVVKTKLQGRGWSHWLEVPGIKYD